MRLVWREFDRNSRRDILLLERICRNSGSDSVKRGASYLRTAVWQTAARPETLWCEILNDCAFYMCVRCRKHVRGVDTVVMERFHGRGLGRILHERRIERMKAAGIDTFRFRTSQTESAFSFWSHMGARPVCVNGDDFEMEIKIDLGKGNDDGEK